MNAAVYRDGLSNVLNSLNNNHGVVGGFINQDSDTGDHMMIIRGIDFKARTFSVMDPASRLGDMYRTGQIVSITAGTTYDTLEIPDVYGAVMFGLLEYLYM